MRRIGISVLFGALIASATCGQKGFRSAISPDGKNEISLYLKGGWGQTSPIGDAAAGGDGRFRRRR